MRTLILIPTFLDITLYTTNSKSQAGGVGLYIANKLEFSRKTDQWIASCWVELACHKRKNSVIGCIYQHPKGCRSLFYETLTKQLETIVRKGGVDPRGRKYRFS